MLLPLVVLLVAPAAEPNEAEKLFREMEAKVTKAKNVECVYEAKAEFGKGTGSVKGTLLIGEGNKVRVEVDGEFAGMKDKRTSVSDGTKGVLDIDKNSPALSVPKWLHEAHRAAITRAGLLEPAFVVQPPGQKDTEFQLESKYQVADFKLGKKEKVGEQEAQVIQYTLKATGTRVTFAVSVWVDTKTQLPLKRVLSGMMGDQKITVNETFTKLDLDAKIDPKQFELPKK
jgi:outer membrane lipoprotein-sorting protein